MVRESEFESEDSGFDHLAAQDEEHFFFCPSESTLVQTCVCLTPLRVYSTHQNICAHVKDPISICRKRVGLTAGGMKTRKHVLHTRKKKLGSAVLWLFTFPGESSPKFPCIALGQERYPIKIKSLILHMFLLKILWTLDEAGLAKGKSQH